MKPDTTHAADFYETLLRASMRVQKEDSVVQPCNNTVWELNGWQ
jgi:hypothetical protein